MAVIKINVVVGNIEDVLAVFDRIKIYRSTTGLTGSYAEITGPTTRLVLEAGQLVYTYTDESGDAGYYYKSSYFHATSGLESSLSDAQQGEGDAALDIITVSELKTNYLFGLDLTNDEGTEYPDSLYEWFIKSAVSWVEHRLDLPIRPTRYVEEKHDFMREDYAQYIWLELDHYPVLEVEELKMVLPGEVLTQTFEDSWLHLDKDSGQLQVIPGPGAAGTILLGRFGAWLPLVYTQARIIPGVFRCTYTAGFNTVPADIRDLIGKVAAFGPLNIAGDLLGGAGIASQSISMDGLSQNFNTTSSATNAGYGARLLQYSKEAKEVIPTLHRYYHGVRLSVV